MRLNAKICEFISAQTLTKEITMAYKITDACVACGLCKDACPVDAIKEGTPYTIDPDICVDCGACAGECPNGAIEAG